MDDEGQLEALFGDWLTARANGHDPDLEDVCRAHPEFAQRLREMRQACDLLLACSPAGRKDAVPGGLRERLEHAFGDGLDPQISLDPPPSAGSSGALHGRPGRPVLLRYELEGELARGGMGAILRVWDRDLRRHLAMKVILESRAAGAPFDLTATDAARLSRFLEEAQITGQLDHPGIVPVHELGLDDQGRVYFTMRLVEGRDLRRIFELASTESDGWNETRALGVLLKACEAVAYAHKKGVIHRDLKPANVMVGNFGEVYVMDWGLARVLGRRDLHGPRVDTRADSASGEDRGLGSGGPLLTRDGDVIGTPAYMPPEQARGEIERLGPRCDVYSLGAMLYHLLAHRPPYVPAGEREGARSVLAQVLHSPPEPLGKLRNDVPAELASICEKAMARDPEQRYADTLELANDLRAFLENRVVSAYETGAWAETRKWIGRNKALAASVAIALALLVAGLTASLTYKARADQKAIEASEQARIAHEQEALATAQANDVLSLSAIQELSELVARADQLWPARAHRIPELEAWLAQARALLDGRAADASGGRARPGLADHRRKLAQLESRADADDLDVRWWRTQLSKLVADLEALADPATGLASSGLVRKQGWGVQRRLDVARTLADQSIDSPEARRLWDEAIAAIRDPAVCPHYAGLELTPQLGLRPIGRDPRSGLWEFAHLETGTPAERASDGTLRFTEESGLVFVLVPGGTFAMGAQQDDPAGPGFDPLAVSNEAPVRDVTLAPFFLSKFELTQAQFLGSTGVSASQYPGGFEIGGKRTTLLNPAERVSAEDAAMMLTVFLDLELPTEAQWEYAARAGTRTPWPTGAEKESLQGSANLGDRHAKTNGGPAGRPYEEWLDDGYTVHAPVGSFAPNAWGFHDMTGNVLELCRDGLASYEREVAAEDGLRSGTPLNSRVIRGGSYFSSAANARVSRRNDVAPEYSDFSIGLRPARKLTR